MASGCALDLDVAEFEAAVARAAAAQERGKADQATQALTAAVAAYTGDLLPDCYDDWILPLRERLHQAYGDALERLVLALEERRDASGAIPYAQRLLHHDPLHEAAYRHLMRLHMAQDDWTEALHIYHACTTMLKREFGAAPARATRDLYERLLKMRERPPAAAGQRRHTAGRPALGRPAELNGPCCWLPGGLPPQASRRSSC